MLYVLGGVTILLVLSTAYFLALPLIRGRTSAAPTHDETLSPTPVAQLRKLRQRPGLWGYRVESHCRAASGLAGRRYPIEHDAPLPAENCEIGRCRCILAGLPEQRRIIDRRNGFDRRRTIRMEASERRTDRPRRKADLNMWGGYGHL